MLIPYLHIETNMRAYTNMLSLIYAGTNSKPSSAYANKSCVFIYDKYG